MPYKIDQDGQKWCVVKDDGSGKVMGCHESESDAKRQLSALYANEPAAEVESLFKEAMDSVGDPAHGRVW
jgi:hypothetical protein